MRRVLPLLVVTACAEPGGIGRVPAAEVDVASQPRGDATSEPAGDDVASDTSASASDASTTDIASEPVDTTIVIDAADVAPTCACTIEGGCQREGERKAGNLCRLCRAAESTTAWTSLDGSKCDDGDACTVGESCVLGLCGGGKHLTGGACAEVEPACATHFDCYPTRVCARWRSDGDLHCSEPCAGDGDCDAGSVCVKVPGSAQIGACEPMPVTLRGLGATCADDGECASGLCLAGACRATCLDEAACATGTCRLEDDPAERARGEAPSGCAPPDDLLPIGAVCTPDGESYGGVACQSGHCDLMPYPATMTLPCAPLCAREEDCGAGRACGVVMYGEVAHPEAIAFHPALTTPTHDAVTACFTTPAGAGSRDLGAPCSAPSECRSDKCLHLLPGVAQRYCSGLCASDDDCPSGMACKPDSLTLASPWLQSPNINAQPARPDLRTLVRVCKFE